MKPSAAVKPMVATSLALFPVDFGEVAEVPLEHGTFDGIVKLLDNVKSAHWSGIFSRSSGQYERREGSSETYLIEVTVTSVEKQLNCHIGTVLNAADSSVVQVKRNAKPALSRGTGKVSRELLLARRAREVGERRRVLHG